MFRIFKKRQPDGVKQTSRGNGGGELPADQIFIHATHPKAGSQWVQAILADLFGQQAIPNLAGNGNPSEGQFLPGKFYLSVYLSPNEIQALCPNGRALKPVFVMRDLRDTLVSLYFSLKVSHAVLDEFMASARVRLTALNEEDGLIYLIESQLRNSAQLQKAWVSCHPASCVKFESLTADPATLMPKLLRDTLGLDIPQDVIESSCAKFAFERLTGGRRKGEEDTKSHLRSGAAGGWRKHFTPAVCSAFKDEFPDLMVVTGYESDDDWSA